MIYLDTHTYIHLYVFYNNIIPLQKHVCLILLYAIDIFIKDKQVIFSKQLYFNMKAKSVLYLLVSETCKHYYITQTNIAM